MNPQEWFPNPKKGTLAKANFLNLNFSTLEAPTGKLKFARFRARMDPHSRMILGLMAVGPINGIGAQSP